MSNRFALFASDDDEVSPTTTSPTNNPFVNQVANGDGPWEQVRRRGPVPKPARPMRTLVIRATNSNPSVISGDDSNSSTVGSQQNRRVSSESAPDSNSVKTAGRKECFCGVCRLTFLNKSGLITHMKLSPNMHQHYCGLCKRVFKDRNSLRDHVDHAADHEIQCNLCLSAFLTPFALKVHLEDNHVLGHNYACLPCLLGFRAGIELDKHLLHGEAHVWCKTCHRKFRSQGERDEHWKVTTKHKHCLQPGCDFDAPDEAMLEKHIAEDHWRCEGCLEVFPSKTKLNQHYETCMHDVDCPDCGKICAGRAELVSHRKSCFYCTECDYQTNYEGQYQVHINQHENVEFPCWFCNASLRRYSTMISHFESGNCAEFPDPTQLMRCLGKFWYSTLYMDIDIHVQIRSNRVNVGETVSWMQAGSLRPFICRATGCNKTFGQFSSLVLHVESTACEWNVQRLRLDLVQAELDRMLNDRRDSAF